MKDDHSPVLVRMPNEIKAALVREAKAHGRTLTGEINKRLKESLGALHGPTLTGILEREQARKSANDMAIQSPATGNSVTMTVEQNAGAYGPIAEPMHSSDLVMLQLWRRLSAEKQLALLTLLR